LRYFKTSFVILFLGVFLIAAVTQDIELIGVSLLLILLEVSLSFDNAVVNAKVLSHMSPLWQRRFLVWGILIAVFGMRLLFPVAMVAWTSDYSMLEVTRLALYEPQLYGEALNEGLPIISAFGGAFLLMVCVWNFSVMHHEPSIGLNLLKSYVRRLLRCPNFCGYS
jgi:hypothetical protein